MPKEIPDLTLFHLKLAFVGKHNSNCVPGFEIGLHSLVQGAKLHICTNDQRNPLEKWAKNCVFGAIIEKKNVQAQR